MIKKFTAKNPKTEAAKCKQYPSLYTDTKVLAMPKGRRVGQPGHAIAIGYLEQRMSASLLQPFKGNRFQLTYKAYVPDTRKEGLFTNLVGVLKGADSSLPPILIGAHYDSVIDAPCADDNATSVAMNLALMDAFSEMQRNAAKGAHVFQRDIIFAFFDAEEPPYFRSASMGSTRFYEDHCKEMQFAGVIVTDLIGHDFQLADLIPSKLGKLTAPLNLKHLLFLTGSETDKAFPPMIEKLSEKHPKLGIFPTLNSYIGNLSDHHAFQVDGHPFLFFSCAQGKYYHHELDNLDWINFEKLDCITALISDIIFELDKTPATQRCVVNDPIDYEMRMITKALGSGKVALLEKALRMKMPKTRQELDGLTKKFSK